MFKESFKYYKARLPPPDYSEVIDLDRVEQVGVVALLMDHRKTDVLVPGMMPPSSWSCWTLQEHPGVIVIRNAFTTIGQRYWIARCLRDFPRKPNIVNLNPRLYTHTIIEDWWRALMTYSTENKEHRNLQRRIKNGLRWTTLGYHHDWDTKIYSDSKRTPFPADLAEICQFLSNALDFQNFTAEAAIINYYPVGTTLAPHTDHSEIDLNAPLFSLSFGQTAIFLIGGETKEIKPTALFLKSGDVLVMSQASRLCYHAVPRILNSTNMEFWNNKVTQAELETSFTKSTSEIDTVLLGQVANEGYWKQFSDYLCDARINLNIRQVLPDGMHSLERK